MVKHTKTPWGMDTERNDDGNYGSGENCSTGFDSYAIYDANGDVVCDFINSGSIEVETESTEDGEYAWDRVAKANANLIVHRVNGWDEQQAKIDELASLLDKALEDVSKVDRWGEPHQPTIDFVNRCLELITLTRAKGA